MSLFMMDEYSGKKAGDGAVVSKKSSSLILRDTANNRDRNAQFCNRIGCSGRLNSAKGTQISLPEKAKSSRPSFRSFSNGKEIIGSSSRTSSSANNPKKLLPGPRKKPSSQPERDSSETGGSSDVPEVPGLVPPPGKIQKSLHSESDNSGSTESITSMEVGNSSISSSRAHRSFHQKSGLGKLDSQIGSPVSLLSKSTSQSTRASAGRNGLRSLRCGSISDVVPAGSSTPDSNLTRQKDTIRKRICEGESSTSSRGKTISGPSLEGKNSSSGSSISISDSRRIRNGTSSRDNGPASSRTRRSLGYTRSRNTNQGGGNNLSPNESHVIPQISERIMPIDSTSPVSYQFSMESPLSRSRAYGFSGNTSESLRGIRPSSPAETGNIRSSVNRESLRHYNMDGIAEVLLALERIEQDEELSYEQFLVLETSLFLNGLNFYDQHRDMRLDIDNMSYEELLALEERMGNVSTALTEEALSECLKTSIYQSASLEDASSDHCGEKDDVKCSVCQEEYAVGDEVGRLQCEHSYHVACIQQWLRLKNWCPICKASAAPSSLPPASTRDQ